MPASSTDTRAMGRSLRTAGLLKLAVAVVLHQLMTNTEYAAAQSLITTPAADPCLSNPCLNGGSCTSYSTGYICMCVSGFTGIVCEIEYAVVQSLITTPAADPCSSNPCLNGGSCTSYSTTGTGYVCMCVSGFTGIVCEIDPCLSNPCLNGGSCTSYSTGYVCMCVSGFTGIVCEIDINECASRPCMNGGTCVDAINAYACICLHGTTGPNCQILTFKSCPKSIHIDLSRGETHAYVTWAEPLLTGDLNGELVYASPPPGSGFSIGYTRVVYSAHLPNVLQEGCAFNVSVAMQPGPVVKNCPQDISIFLPEGQVEGYVTWPEPQVIGGSNNVTEIVTNGTVTTTPGTSFSIGNHELTYNDANWGQLCSFNISVYGILDITTIGSDFYCTQTSSVVLSCMMSVAVVAAIGFCFMYIRSKRRLSSGSSRAMVPREAISQPKTINNSTCFSAAVDRSGCTKANAPRLPPVPPPYPKPGELLEDKNLDNAYEVLDNYGYMCFELKKQNTMYQLPRAVYQK